MVSSRMATQKVPERVVRREMDRAVALGVCDRYELRTYYADDARGNRRRVIVHWATGAPTDYTIGEALAFALGASMAKGES
jgi:hypothetical protein